MKEYLPKTTEKPSRRSFVAAGLGLLATISTLTGCSTISGERLTKVWNIGVECTDERTLGVLDIADQDDYSVDITISCVDSNNTHESPKSVTVLSGKGAEYRNAALNRSELKITSEYIDGGIYDQDPEISIERDTILEDETRIHLTGVRTISTAQEQ